MPDLNLSFWTIQTVAMMATAILLPGLRVTSIFGALAMVVALALINAHYWDANLFFSLPSAFSTKALFLLLMNGLIFFILTKILPGIEISSLTAALVAPIVFTVLNLVISRYAPLIDWAAIFAVVENIFLQAKSFIIKS